MALFYEVNLVNLLETVLYSEQGCESLGDSAIDLADFCILKLTNLLSEQQPKDEVSQKSMSKSGWIVKDSKNVYLYDHFILNFLLELMEELANWTPGKELPEIPIEDVSEEIQRHLRETHFQVIS